MKAFTSILILFFIVSCQKENQKVEKFNKFGKSQNISSINALMYSDPDYIALNNLSYQLVNQMLPNADLQYLTNGSGTISQSQFIYTVKTNGF